MLPFHSCRSLHGKSLWNLTVILIVGAIVLPSDVQAQLQKSVNPGVIARPEVITTRSNVADEDVGQIDLSTARARALENHPRLRAAQFMLESQRGLVFQAGRRLNPEIRFDVENLGGNSTLEGIGVIQNTLGLSQTLRTARKRKKLIRSAEVQEGLSRWDREAARRDLIQEVDSAFYGLLAAQRSLEIAESLVDVARQSHASIQERVKEGQTTPVEAVRSGILHSQQEIECRRRTAGHLAAKRRLAAAMGSADVPSKAVGSLELHQETPTLEELTGGLDQNPDIARWVDEIRAVEAELAVARARGVPDVTVGGAYRRGQSIGEEAYVLEVSLPLPVNDRNRGLVRSLEKKLQAACEQRDLIRLEVRRDLELAYRNLEAVRAQADLLDREVVPGATRAFEAIQEGYRLGMFGLIDALDAQRTLFASRADLVDALFSYHSARIAVSRLAGPGEPLHIGFGNPGPSHPDIAGEERKRRSIGQTRPDSTEGSR